VTAHPEVGLGLFDVMAAPLIVFHIATCGGTRLRNENSPALRLTSERENRPKMNDLVNGGDAAMLYQRRAANGH